MIAVGVCFCYRILRTNRYVSLISDIYIYTDKYNNTTTNLFKLSVNIGFNNGSSQKHTTTIIIIIIYRISNKLITYINTILRILFQRTYRLYPHYPLSYLITSTHPHSYTHAHLCACDCLLPLILSTNYNISWFFIYPEIVLKLFLYLYYLNCIYLHYVHILVVILCTNLGIYRLVLFVCACFVNDLIQWLFLNISSKLFINNMHFIHCLFVDFEFFI